jgi:hypothetical protein
VNTPTALSLVTKWPESVTLAVPPFTAHLAAPLNEKLPSDLTMIGFGLSK